MQWKNTDSVIDWFCQLKDKERLTFIQFDIVNFYGSITPRILNNAITFAAKYISISELEKKKIMQATNSFLCSNGQTWVKKEGGIFDITMGGHHGAEVCDLIGLYILSQLIEVLPNTGLYRDDGLSVSTATNRQIEIMKKKVCKVFQDNGLAVTIEANSKIVNFLDVTFDLNSGIYKPFMKENDTPIYVHCGSNHPPSVLRNIPLGVNNRLNRISSSKAVFDSAAPVYQEALNKSGYTHKLEFKPKEPNCTKKKNRKRNITWFNPPFSSNVKTQIGKEFLKLIDTAFPQTNPLHKLFTRQTVKVCQTWQMLC
jgi:hypothetical protein